MEFFSRTYSFWAQDHWRLFHHGNPRHGSVDGAAPAERDERQSRTALMASWVVILVQFVLFLLIGVLLYVHYADLHLAARHKRTGYIPSWSGTTCRPVWPG